MIQNGFQRLVLLGSAGYSRAELPLDDSVSLIAPNNTGKTSLINALQFLLIIDQRRMDFGAHEFEKTRRFYFPNNSAYILLEASTPQSGTIVLGCVGKGISHDYQYFAYEGSLNIDDFKLADGSLLTQPNLVSHFGSLGKTVHGYNNSSDFASLVYGGQRTSKDKTFTLFQLENASDAQAYRQVLTSTLRLDKLTSADAKRYLLDIFRRDLPDHNIDFKKEWDKAFSEVNADKAQYEAALKNQKTIFIMEQAYQQRRELRGKLLEWRPRIDAGLQAWQEYYAMQKEELASQRSLLQEQQGQQLERDRNATREQTHLLDRKQKLDQQQTRQFELANRFALVAERVTLQQQFEQAKEALEAQITRLGQVKIQSRSALMNDMQRKSRELSQWQQQLATLDDNLFLKLSQALNEQQLSALNRVLGRQVMTLATADFDLNAAQLRSLIQADQVSLPGLTLRLQQLQEQHKQHSGEFIAQQIDELAIALEQHQEQLAVIDDLEQQQQRKQQLEQELKACEQALDEWDELVGLITNEADRTEEQKLIHGKLSDIEILLARSQEESQQLNQNLNQLADELNKLERSHSSIDRLRNRRLDNEGQFTYLHSLDHQTWLAEAEWPLSQLDSKLQEYQDDCAKLKELDERLRSSVAELHSLGLSKYQFEEDRDTELRKIIEFTHNLGREAEALEKSARSAVVNVTASLRDLRDGLWGFKSRMKEFNQLISRQQLSDLEVFKIDAVDEEQLVKSIDTLISTAEKVDSGETYDLFNQGSVLDDDEINRAKQVLIDEGNARQGLKVSDLFRLQFVVAKAGQSQESFSDIDSAASNGTVLMAKLVTGLAMLYLMQDKRYKMRTLCYLDEALALDRKNQKSLISTAAQFGFSLIFASPSPLTTARYCVPISQHQGKNHISRQNWQIFEALHE